MADKVYPVSSNGGTKDDVSQVEALFREFLEEKVNSPINWGNVKSTLEANPVLYDDKYSQSTLWHMAMMEDNDDFVRTVVLKNPMTAFHKLKCKDCTEADGDEDGCIALRCAVVHNAFSCADAILQLYRKILTTPFPSSDDSFNGSLYVDFIDINHITLMLRQERYMADTLDMLTSLIKWPVDVKTVVDGHLTRVKILSDSLLAGSDQICPENFWTEERGIKICHTGVFLDTYVVPLKGAASLRPAFLLSLVSAVKTCKTHKNEIFANEVVEIIVNFKWRTFIRGLYYFDAMIHIVWTHAFLINAIYFAKTYTNHVTPGNTIVTACLLCINICFYVYFVIHETKDFFTTMTHIDSFHSLCLSIYRHCFNLWNFLDMIILLAVFLSILTHALSLILRPHVSSVAIDEVHRYFRVTSAIVLPFLALKILFYMQGDHHTAAIIRMIKKVTQGTFVFAFILLIICMGFAGSFTLLFEKQMFNGDFDAYSTFDRALVSIFATMFGDFDLQPLYACYSPQTAIVLLFFFLTFVGLILLNLLIAIMGDQYQQVNDNKLAQAVYGRALIVSEYERVTSFSTSNELAWFPTWIQYAQPRNTLPRLIGSQESNGLCRDKS